MTSIELRGVQYKVKQIKYGAWKQLFSDRSEAMSNTDPLSYMKIIDKWVLNLTEIPQDVLDDLTLQEIEELAKKLGESQQLPLQSSVKSAEPSSPTIPALS